MDSLPLPDPMVMYTKAELDRHSSETEFFHYKPAKLTTQIGVGDVQRDSTHASVLLGCSGIDTPMVGSFKSFMNDIGHGIGEVVHVASEIASVASICI